MSLFKINPLHVKVSGLEVAESDSICMNCLLELLASSVVTRRLPFRPCGAAVSQLSGDCFPKLWCQMPTSVPCLGVRSC